MGSEMCIRDSLLATRIARAHDFARTGAKIRDRVYSQLQHIAGVQESTGRFLWGQDGPAAVVEYRPSDSKENQRSIDQIALAELCGLVREQQPMLSENDPALAIARHLGLSRLKASTRERLEEGIERFLELNSESKKEAP